MAKYIIDVPDNTQWIQWMNISEKDGSACFDYKAPEDLTPYTEPDRESIENEVWSIAREIAYCMSLQECIDTGMLHDDDIYDSASGVLEKLTYQEAKAKFEAWRKQKDGFHVGDEVELFGRAKGLVYVVGEEVLEGIYSNYNMLLPFCWRKKDCRKTGKHFPEIAELMKKMREHRGKDGN